LIFHEIVVANRFAAATTIVIYRQKSSFVVKTFLNPLKQKVKRSGDISRQKPFAYPPRCSWAAHRFALRKKHFVYI
jgi:hypothetical protein